MANLINNNFKIFKLNTYRGDYWDFTLNKDMQDYGEDLGHKYHESKPIYFLDCANFVITKNNEILGLSEYYWDNAYNVGCMLENVGYTGFDNGLFY